MIKNVQLTGILGKPRLDFKDNRELEEYYEGKYRQGGYEGGFIVCGINISRINHRARHESALRFLKPKPDEMILDAGCGDGELSAQIAPRCRAVHAIDIAGNALASQYRSIANLHFEKMNVEILNFDDGFFDQIVCVEALEHVLNPHTALQEFHRTLKPGGKLVVTYPTINKTRVKKIQRSLGIDRPLAISEHLTEWSFDEIIENAKRAGFELVDAEGLIFDFGVLGWIKFSSRFLARAITALSLGIRGFPRNSCAASLVFRKRSRSSGEAAVV